MSTHKIFDIFFVKNYITIIELYPNIYKTGNNGVLKICGGRELVYSETVYYSLSDVDIRSTKSDKVEVGVRCKLNCEIGSREIYLFKRTAVERKEQEDPSIAGRVVRGYGLGYMIMPAATVRRIAFAIPLILLRLTRGLVIAPVKCDSHDFSTPRIPLPSYFIFPGLLFSISRRAEFCLYF